MVNAWLFRAVCPSLSNSNNPQSASPHAPLFDDQFVAIQGNFGITKHEGFIKPASLRVLSIIHKVLFDGQCIDVQGNSGSTSSSPAAPVMKKLQRLETYSSAYPDEQTTF